ncbi:hypothetical protein A2276_02815 [candidate division WOR-1 bacterium RIFOXYA12_FULL_43_27]|uniref:Uncharacterized protein n=1 Tax=candidate division WOR-1 bacterium RIFOXYC2_FULL_46_14 TaxID=1802587 RepID=A0A1F4U7Y0_UNCSA|nr:MAG: hypothetical protein A2276_02815 [candidate division WOR-1 bacterium RIFOXYA12_FULL_43_27]OGC19360.1 MAG: hypothetical protein A2292_01520 [candidate division WOR-1 bacterium RIFOXYB2_FULL_46_45]OGC30349.1 MAG: hypothetical protein A2232_01520 [candidate division WOR-1 bacterium RIFOXYA2_FULL_46_56]OGC40950.1 MAG: hypothetical protein A2438_01520 [candidate division WOR-1 bacterium RIFOXYC2_FULL_46_14]
MALLIGKFGRQILACCNKNPQSRLSRLGDGLGRVAHKISSNYTPGLSRETLKVWQHLILKPDETISIKPDGFYAADSKIAGDHLVAEAFLKAGRTTIDPRQITSPEELANLCREKSFIFLHSSLSALLPLTFLSLSAVGALSLPASIFFMASFLPTYKLIEGVINFNKRNLPCPTLLEAENAPMEIFSCDNEGAFFSEHNPGKIFIGKSFPEFISYDEAVFHETTHALGASEEEAMTKTQIYGLKLLFSGKFSVAKAMLVILQSVGFYPCINMISMSIPFTHHYSPFRLLDPYQLMAIRGERQQLQQQIRRAGSGINKTKDFENLLNRRRELVAIYTALGKRKAALRLNKKLFKDYCKMLLQEKLSRSERRKYVWGANETGVAVADFYYHEGDKGKAAGIKRKLERINGQHPKLVEVDGARIIGEFLFQHYPQVSPLLSR